MRKFDNASKNGFIISGIMQMIFTQKEQPKIFYLCNIMRELINEGYGYVVSIIEDMIPDDEFCAFI